MKIPSEIAENVILTRWVNLDDYLDLRDLFLQIYEDCAEMVPLKEHFADENVSDLQGRASNAGKKAGKFNPHNIIFDPLNSFNKMFKSGYVLVLVLGWILHRLGIISVGVLSGLISFPSIGEVLVNYGIPVTWIIVGIVYLEALRRDNRFLRKMNERLKIDQDTIEEESEKPKVISYLFWNRGLMRNTTIPVLAFLTVIRGVHKELFDDGLRFANLTLFYHLEEGMSKMEALGAAFSHIRRGYLSE